MAFARSSFDPEKKIGNWLLAKEPVLTAISKRMDQWHSERGDIVEVYRKRMQRIRGQVIDEMSMLTPQHNFQIDYRCKQAKLKTADHLSPYGGIGTTLAGDFMQLPPV